MAKKASSGNVTHSLPWILMLAVVVLGIIGLAMLVVDDIFTAMELKKTAPEQAEDMWIGTVYRAIRFLMLPIVAVLLYFLIRSLRENVGAADHAVRHLERIESIQEDQTTSLRNIAGLACLSDQAKSLIYYEHELEALRESVQAMVMKQDYASAEAMIQRMESRLGMVEEAARIREEIENIRKASLDEKIDAAIARIDSILERHQWAQAKREAERMMALFPDNPKVTALPQRVRDAWTAYKRKLLKDYGEAVRVNDVEKSIALLKELDRYLTPQEGAALAESARDVFKKKLHNLGVQFAIAVSDQNWDHAVATGEEIINEYPNTRMAREVKEKLDVLRDYATGRRQPPSQAQQMMDKAPTPATGKNPPPPQK